MDNPFWAFSLAAYSREEVARACLDLQDNFGLDVNLLLYAAWLAQCGARLDAGHLAAMERQIADWRECVVRPLRELRRTWRGNSRAERLREELKRLELRAEREQQDMMYELHRSDPPPPLDAADSVADTLLDNLLLVAHPARERDAGCEAGLRRLRQYFTQ